MIGTQLAGRYEIVQELGHGGMGVVYLAKDPLLDREVAVKVLTQNLFSREVEDRFKREARVVAKMDHPGIVPIYDTGEHQGSLFFVMPYVPGTSLRSYLQRGGLRLGDVIDIGIQVAEALEYSHNRGVVHRDIKPENILVYNPASDAEAATVRVRVTDFGLAMDFSQTRITQAGLVVGTMAYVSPEQVAGEEVDGRSDVYSLGSVLYECLVGEVPFPQDYPAILYFIVHEPPKTPHAKGVRLDDELEQLILRCLDKRPAQRPPRAKELADALALYRSRLGLSDRDKAVYLPPRGPSDEPSALFVGRDEELAELQRRLNLAVSGECQLAIVGGEPGVGKTKLLEELEGLARRRRILVLHSRFMERDQAFPYQGFCDAIQEFFRGKPTGSSAPADFSDLASDLVSLFPVLSEIGEVKSSLTSGVKPATAKSGEFQDKTYVFDLLARSFTRIGGGKPLVMLLEDLHAASASIEALEYIVRRLGATPTLLVATYRTTEVDRRHPLVRLIESFQGDRRFTHLKLGAFSTGEHRKFLESLLGKKQINDSLVTRLYEATEGNPYFTRELVRSVIESRSMTRDDSGTWVLSGETEVLLESLPATIQQTVERRIERLPEELKDVLSIASVLGRSFTYDDLAVLVKDDGSLDAKVDRLVKDGFLEEDRHARGDLLRFSSGVLRDVLYAALSRRRQRALHRSYAEELERRHAGRVDRVLSPLVHHYAQADAPEKVIEYGVRLLRKLIEAFGSEDAIRVGRLVLSSLEDDETGPQLIRGDVKVLLATAYRLGGNFESALKEIEGAIRVFERETGVTRLVSALLQAAETAWEGRKVDEARRFVERGYVLGRASGDPKTLSRLLVLGATVANLRGDAAKAKEYLDESELLLPTLKESSDEVPIGGTLTVALVTPITARHPADVKLDDEGEIFANVFETLLTTDPQGNLVPTLCESWEVRDGGRTFLFELRRNVKLHDGRPLTASEIKSSFEGAMRRSRAHHPPDAFVAIAGATDFLIGQAEHVSGLKALSDDRLQIDLLEALPIYPALLTDQRTGMARGQGVSDSGEVPRPGAPADRARPIFGTGPFKIATLTTGLTALERNPDFWRGPAARLARIEFRTAASSADIARGLRAGEYDMARDLLPQDLESLLRDRRLAPGLVEAPKKNVYFALFNTGSPVAGSLALRRALCGIVRPNDLVRSTLGRFAQPAEGILPPGIFGHDPGRRRPLLFRDQALDLIKASGLPKPVKLNVAVHPILLDRFRSLTSGLFRLWDDLGVQVHVITDSMESFLVTKESADGVDVRIGRWIADYDDPDSFTYALFHTRVGEFRRYFSSVEVDEMAEAARLETRPSVRERLYRKIETLLLDGGVVLPLFHDIDVRVTSPKLKKVTLRSVPPYVNYAQLGKVEHTEARVTRREAGGVVRVPIVDELVTLDRYFAYHLVHDEILPILYEGLTRVEEARTVPWLASEYRVEDGGRTYRFTLRENVRFHDGRLLTARDVRFSFEQLLQHPDSRNTWLLKPIKGARELQLCERGDLSGFEILSPSELLIRLEEPVSFFPVLLSHPSAGIVPEGTALSGGAWLSRWIGTGPFRVVRFDPGRRLELEANPHYWRKGFPKSEGLTFTFGVTPHELLAGFKSGEYSMAWDLLPADVEALRRAPEYSSRYKQAPRLSTYFLAFNAAKGPLASESLRKKLVSRLDVEDLVRRHIGRLASPATTLIPPGLVGHEPLRRDPPVLDGRVAEDVELAIGLHSVFEGRCSGLAKEVLAVLKHSGFAPHVVNTRAESPDFLATGAADIIAIRWVADYPDADTFIHGICHSQNGLVGRFFGDATLDALIERGRTESKTEVRHEIYRQIEEILAERALVLPLFHEQAYRFARPELEGLEVTFSSPIVCYDKLWIR